MTQETKTCQNCKKSSQIEEADFKFYEKMGVMPPEECFYCRLMRRLAFWPFGKFHNRACDLTGEKIISIFPDGARFPVYKTTHWYSDKWESPAMEYNPERPFFEQFYELQSKTPRPHQYGTQNTNCEWSDDVWESRNCYLCRSLAQCEYLSYSYRTFRCRDSFDLFYCYDAEQSYDCVYCFNISRVGHAWHVRDSFDSQFLYDCRNVSNCFMCWNLRNKQYHILNKPYSKEGYFEKLKEYNTGSWSVFQKIKKEFEERVKNDALHRTNFNVRTVRSTGNYLTDCKNCQECYFLEASEDCGYVFRGAENKGDIYDSNGVLWSELIYEVMQLTSGYNLRYSMFGTNCRDSEYLDFCVDCENCFGCTGLRKKRYCVLNKQYTPEEYKTLVSKIKAAMQKEGSYGKFFPYKMAYGGYNLSLAGIMEPKTKEEVVRLGGYWEELEQSESGGVEIVPFADDINDVDENIIYKGLRCEESGRFFNVTKEEVAFLKRSSIPLPRHYPDVRTMHRVKKLFYLKPSATQCFFCSKEIISYYPPELGYKKIACEGCYNNEVI